MLSAGHNPTSIGVVQKVGNSPCANSVLTGHPVSTGLDLFLF